MITELLTIRELKDAWLEIFFNHQDTVTKVADTSVVAAHAYASAKLGQKAMMATALLESQLLPDAARGAALDQACALFGFGPRAAALGSSTYLRLAASAGTRYQAGLHSFSGAHGQIFDLERDAVVGAYGFTYAKVRSRALGAQTNVDALTITSVTDAPATHAYVVNEYQATGGRDAEDDATLRERMRQGPDLLATDTLSELTQALLLVNPNVLRVQHQGLTAGGRLALQVISQNGVDFSGAELGAMLAGAQGFLGLGELRPDGLGSYGVEFQNPAWFPIDVSVRAELHPGTDPDTARREMQLRTQKLLDYRYWIEGQSFQWDDALQVAKTTAGVRYVPDQHFVPRQDIQVPRGYLPRVRGFLLLDLQGHLLSGQNSNLNPFFYPREADFSYQRTALLSLPQ